jgi:TPR repeat protein
MNRAAHAGDAELRAVWLWRALGKGNLEAPVELARMYEQGDGVVQSCDQAQVLLRSAAAKGNEQAKLNLQQIHRRGGCSGR